MERCVEATIGYDEKEVKKAISFFILTIQQIKIAFLIIYPILAAVVVLTLIYDRNSILSILYLICGYLFFYFYYSRPIDGYIKFYQKRKGGAYKFTDANVSIIGAEIQSVIAWSAYKKAYEIPSAFLLLDDNKFIYVFPKKCFKNDNDIELLCSLIGNAVPIFKQYS